MAGAKLVVLYPYPQDVDAFERAYTEDHAPGFFLKTVRRVKAARQECVTSR